MGDYKTPGQLIVALLEERGWTQKILASVLDISTSRLSRVVAGTQPVTAELALALGEVFSEEPERFLEIQKKYDLAIARLLVEPDPKRQHRATLLSELPIREMIARGWLQVAHQDDLAAVEAELFRFFEAESVDDIAILPHAAKKSNVSSDVTPAQLAWLYRVKQIASGILVGPYSPVGVRAAIKKLDGLLASPEEVRHVPRILDECGVRFVVVESLRNSHIDGACFWLDELSPVIGMTLRYDRIDNFWFVLRHELEHVIRGHGKDAPILDAELEGSKAGVGEELSEQERIANRAAASFCVDQEKLSMYISRKDPFFSDRDVVALSRMLDIHPGLVVGQLQHRTGRYDLLRKHLAKIRAVIRPNAFTDGWGDIAPV